jgi:ribosomal protein L24E
VVFLEQRREPEFLAWSEANTELAKKNKYHHHLGTGGYQRQVPKWRQEEATKKAAGLSTLSQQLGERTVNWTRARKPRKTEAGVPFDDPMLDREVKSIFAVAAKQHEGLFKP